MENGRKKRRMTPQDRRIVRYMLLAALLVLAILRFDRVLEALGILRRISQPLVVGAVIAYMMNIVVRLFESIYFPHSKKSAVEVSRLPVCVMGALLLILGMLVLLVRMIIPGLISAFELIGQELPRLLEQLKVWITENEDVPLIQQLVGSMQLDMDALGTSLLSYVTGGLPNVLTSTVTVVTVVGGSVVNFFMSIVFALFLLLGKNRLRSQADRLMDIYLRPAWLVRLRHGLAVAHKAFSSFIIGQCASGLVLGVLCAVGMMIFRMPYAVMAGVISGTTALIPIIGGYVGAILSAFLVFTVDPVQALWFLVFIVILQQVEGNLVYPRLVGSSIGLPGIWVLVAVTLGGGLAGIPGMLIGVPLAATAYALIQEHVRNRAKKMNDAPTCNENTEENEAEKNTNGAA